jgi:hypothetical protein
MDDITYVGLDVHKATVCVAIAEGGRGGEVRQIGVFETFCRRRTQPPSRIVASRAPNWPPPRAMIAPISERCANAMLTPSMSTSSADNGHAAST